MSRPSPKRKYNSAGRKARAAVTRNQILKAGKALFARKGIDDASIEEIAEAADVAASTIYSLFRSKSGILKALMEEALLGAKYIATLEKYKSVTDPLEQLKVTASIARTIYDSEKSELGLVRGASSFSNDLKLVEEEFERIRYQKQKSRAEAILRMDLAPEGMSLPEVRDVMWALTSREVYQKLVMDRGWTSDAYEKWLARALKAVLIR